MKSKKSLKKSSAKRKKIKKSVSFSNWRVTYTGFHPETEMLRESLCTLGNGYMGTRGAASGANASEVHYPGTYIAGVYNKLPTSIAGRKIYNDDLVNCPNWTFLMLKSGIDNWITPFRKKILSYKQELDLRRGVLIRSMRLEDSKKQRTTIIQERLVHMANPHLAAIRFTVIPENYSTWLKVRTALDGNVRNAGVVRYRDLNSLHLEPITKGICGPNTAYLETQTNQSHIRVAMASKLRVFENSKEISTRMNLVERSQKEISQDFGFFAKKHTKYVIEKTVAIYTSKDQEVVDPLEAAITLVKSTKKYDRLLETHTEAWADLWSKFDIRIDGDLFSQATLRLHIFHILQTASKHNVNIDAGLPARGLHGEAYRGHIFWDEIFVMPLLYLHAPEIARAVLMYRYRRLPEARKYARKNGYRGAMFPWQSSTTGVEETQEVHLNPMSGKWGADASRNQRHISLAIAYNIWKYWDETKDVEFLSRYGAEMLLSISKFFSSLCYYSKKDNRYHTKGLMGPDEFHEKVPGVARIGLKDNAYSNVMIVWMLTKAKEALTHLTQQDRSRLLKKLGINLKEINRWHGIIHTMKVIISQEGIIEQFDGYFGLKELQWKSYRKKYGNIQRMDRILKAERKSPDDFKLAKQADVLMIFYLLSLSEVEDIFNRLGYPFSKDILKKNYAYYEQRTSHGSTLSKVVHCYLSDLLGNQKTVWQWFREVMESDIYDTQGGTTKEGIHLGVMGGSACMVMRGFAGVNILDDRIQVNPRMPKLWKTIKFSIPYQDCWISCVFTKRDIRFKVTGQKPKSFTIPIEIYGKRYELPINRITRIRYYPT